MPCAARTFLLYHYVFATSTGKGQALQPKQTNMKNDVYKRRTVRLHPDDTFFCNTVKKTRNKHLGNADYVLFPVSVALQNYEIPY